MRPDKTRLVTLPKLRVASSSLVFRSIVKKAVPGFGAAFFVKKTTTTLIPGSKFTA
jgi:hypothetical protein